MMEVVKISTMPFVGCAKKRSAVIFLVLRASGDDDHNFTSTDYQAKLGCHAEYPRSKAAHDPAVPDIIRHAEAVFNASGNQAGYVNPWLGTRAPSTPISRAGSPYVGLAVLDEFGYGALNDKDDENDFAPNDALPNPYHPRVTLVHDILKAPYFGDTIMDTLRQSHGTDPGVSFPPAR
jgi:hypothetical protein